MPRVGSWGSARYRRYRPLCWRTFSTRCEGIASRCRRCTQPSSAPAGRSTNWPGAAIERLELVGRSAHDLEIEVVCSKGTYVRVLAEEIAAGLGTLGHLAALRRLWVDPFPAAGLVTLPRIEADLVSGLLAPAWLLPADAAFPGLAPVLLDQTQSLHLRQGRSLEPLAGLAGGPLWRAYDDAHGFLGLVELGPDGRLRVVRLFVAGAGGSPVPQT
jgi:hypothetical protein